MQCVDTQKSIESSCVLSEEQAAAASAIQPYGRMVLLQDRADDGSVQHFRIEVPKAENSSIFQMPDIRRGVVGSTHCAVKEFHNKTVWPPDALDAFRAKNIAAKRAVTRRHIFLAASGYSSLKQDFLDRYKIEKGAYEQGARVLMAAVVRSIQAIGIDVTVLHGVSDMGVDLSLKDCIETLPVDGLGYNSLEFMMYVKDDERGGPVWVAKDNNEYPREYAGEADILLALNGRSHTLQKDETRRLEKAGQTIPVDLISVLSQQEGGVPALDQSGVIQNAAKRIAQVLHLRLPECRTFDELMAYTLAEIQVTLQYEFGIAEAKAVPTMQELTRRWNEQVKHKQ